jgi:hypothetical protein
MDDLAAATGSPHTSEPAATKADDPIEDAVPVGPDVSSAPQDDAVAASDAPAVADSAPPPAPPPPAAKAPPPRPSFVPMVLGGVVAAGLGYAAAWTDILPRPPDPAMTARVEALAAQQAAQDSRLAELASELGNIAARPVADAEARDGVAGAIQRIADESAALRELIAGLEARLAAAADEMGALADRLTVLEERPQVTVALSEAAQAAVEAQIAALRRESAEAIERVEADRAALATDAAARFDALQAELQRALAGIEAEQAALEDARQAAAAEAEASRMAAALASLRAALDAGDGYVAPLQTLADLTGTAPPDALAATAEDGVPTLAALRESFPEAARAGLEAALRAQIAAGEIGRVEGFMRIHSGVRSLTPQDGDSPDAILSRAEAALAGGDIDGALALIDTLPTEGRAAMQTWADQAEIRRAALVALESFGTN